MGGRVLAAAPSGERERLVGREGLVSGRVRLGEWPVAREPGRQSAGVGRERHRSARI
jgi:hypothetical protein